MEHSGSVGGPLDLGSNGCYFETRQRLSCVLEQDIYILYVPYY